MPEPHVRRYVSIFGELAIRRYVYGTREGQQIEAVPLDARLGLPEGDFSYVLEDWQQRLCVKEAFENYRRHMQYDEYLAAGYPIGSGVAEGACRHLVKDRLEQTGMRWTVSGAQSLLHLRAIYLNGDWSEFIEHRIREEQAQIHPHKSVIAV